MAVCSEEGMTGAVQDRHTERLQAHPAPVPQSSTLLSDLTPKVILQGRRQDSHPQLMKVHLRQEENAVTLARETSVFFIELVK